MVCSPSFDPNDEILNKKENPLHLAVKSHWKKDISTQVLSALLKLNILDPSNRDKTGKRPIDYLSKHDSRVKMLEEATCKYKRSISSQHKKPKKNKSKEESSDTQTKEFGISKHNALSKNIMVDCDSSSTLMPDLENECVDLSENSCNSSVENIGNTIAENVELCDDTILNIPFTGYELLSPHKKLDYLVKAILQNFSLLPQSITLNSSAQVDDTKYTSTCQEKSSIETDISKKNTTTHVKDRVKQSLPSNDDRKQVKGHDTDELDFDKLPWEVEIAPNVVKFFKNNKKNSSTNQWAAVQTINKLAQGRRNKHLSKCVGGDKSLHLFEARMTQGARILWEEVVSYSAKLSVEGPSSNPVYTQVIRVWEIVLDHDDLEKRIKSCIEQIQKSHKRGFESSLKRFLDMGELEGNNYVCGEHNIIIPKRFKTTDDATSVHRFIPAASTKPNEYNLKVFHSFDTSTVKSLLLGTNDRRDYPFKVWQEEHEIITLPYSEPVLLLSRSGTGKTTCCLYRLWNEFKNFWNPESPTHGLKLSRKCLISPSHLALSAVDHQLDIDQENRCSLKSVPFSDQATDMCCISSSQIPFSQKGDDSEAAMDTHITPDEMISAKMSCDNTEHNMQDSCKLKIEENLHQLFITKNPELCKLMKKSFYNIAVAHDFLGPQVEHENSHLPNTLSDVSDEVFPLFLTAHQFYILLDNSIGDAKTFFPRDKEGNIQVKIESTDYGDDYNKHIVQGLKEGIAILSSTKRKRGKWMEVTALYFRDHIWKKISHQQRKKFEPMLVWTEIQSFIKGSEIALRKGAPLNREQYKEIGNRMAPSFSNCRDAIYDIFLEYEHQLKRTRHQCFLYDQCDIILDLYNRLQRVDDVPWSIHSVYIDEVQDFTQAELAVLVHCTRDINSMFFTGDTAQTIMRGISFRFEDLRSLFHRMSQCTQQVKVPKEPYNLKINFRSHSGVLNLAGSILDLLTEFFKHSIDHLPNDVSMFQGPIPVLVESCEENDLVLLLRANEREGSSIEFGAHQAILVQSYEARANLPQPLKDALVYTIFEAKGLEFDDVLLYNFFTDSMVSTIIL